MANDIMVQFRTCLESELESKEIIPGSILICKDTGDFYHDSIEGERLRIAKYIHYFDTDTERSSYLTPENEILYIVKETNKIWIYNSSWICLSNASSGTGGTTITVKTWTTADMV